MSLAQANQEAMMNEIRRLRESLKWCIGQFQGESGAGEGYWEKHP